MTEIDSTDLFPIGRKKVRDNSVRGKFRTTWVEGTADASVVSAAAPLIDRGVSHVGSSFGRAQARYFFVAIVLVFGILLARLVYAQIFQGDHFLLLAENNSERIIPIPAERGLLYDRRGRQLTKNVPNFSLALVPQDLPRLAAQRDVVIKELAALVEADEQNIRELIEQYRKYKNESIVIAEDIEYETALKIQIARSQLPGVHIQQGSKRLYLHALSDIGLASSTLGITATTTTIVSLAQIEGYMGKLDQSELETLYPRGYLPSDSNGKLGVEKGYEQMLRGTYGRRRIEVNARGKEQSVLAEYAAIPGAHVVLSIDAAVQAALENSLRHSLEKYHKERGVAVALDPRSGKIVAMVSLPSFDNNDFSGGIASSTYRGYLTDVNRPLYNRAISGTYPSGSTIKPAMAAAALTEHLITPATTVFSNGGIGVGPWFFPDWKAGGHGTTDVARSLAWSVNTFYYYIGGGYGDFVGLGVDKMVSYLQKLNFGRPLGIEIPGEQGGFVPNREWKKTTKGEPWYIGDTYNLSIGQGDLLVTPLQIASLTSIFANGGTLYRPRLAEATINPLTNQRAAVPSEIIQNKILPSESVKAVREGMRDCVVYGSCRQLAGLPMAVAGKTGTAQWNSTKANHAWFTSFTPFESPEIVVTVLVEEGEEGSLTAVPVATEFYKWWWKYRETGQP